MLFQGNPVEQTLSSAVWFFIQVRANNRRHPAARLRPAGGTGIPKHWCVLQRLRTVVGVSVLVIW